MDLRRFIDLFATKPIVDTTENLGQSPRCLAFDLVTFDHVDQFAIPEKSCAGRGRRIGEKELPCTIYSLYIVAGKGCYTQRHK